MENERFQLYGLCGRANCLRLCSRVEYCSAGRRRVKNLWGRRRIANEKPRQLGLFGGTRTKGLLPTGGYQVLKLKKKGGA